MAQRSQIPLDRRPDIIDLAESAYDVVATEPARRTLLICSAPRTGSYELCRLLLAAGIGIPHEYMHPQFAPGFANRFGLLGNPLARGNIGAYIEALRLRRAQSGVFAVNLQYWQIRESLMNQSGRALFDDAHVVHLFRPDIGSQVTSWRVAMNTGTWDFSGRRTTTPREYRHTISDRVAQFAADLKYIAAEDAGFRELFALAGISPQFVTMNELFRAPGEVVRQIAKALGTDVDEDGLAKMVARSAPYPRDEAALLRATSGLADVLKRKAFGQ